MKKLIFGCLSLFMLDANSATNSVTVNDVTEQWKHRYDVVSAFPSIYEGLPKGEDHEDLIRVLEVSIGEGKSNKRRIEVFETAGDCGFSTFAVTDLEQYKYDKAGNILTYNDGRRMKDYSPRAFYIEKYSAWNSEDCGTREYRGRQVTEGREPNNEVDINQFLEEKFIGNDGLVNKSFIPMCNDDYREKNERDCVTRESLGDLGA